MKPANYRPVSLTSICCKAMEHVIHSNIMRHLDPHNILTDQQHGFHRNQSCKSQQLCYVSRQKATDWCYHHGLSEAFDVVPHNRLMLKLDHYGTTGPTHDWISNFLMHRQQRVVVGGEHSDWVCVQSGVPHSAGHCTRSITFPFV